MDIEDKLAIAAAFEESAKVAVSRSALYSVQGGPSPDGMLGPGQH